MLHLEGKTSVAEHLKATGLIVPGMRVTCTSDFGIQKVSGKVLTANNYGTAEKPDWYIELRSPRDGYCYVKQQYDKATVVADTDVAAYCAVLSHSPFAQIVPGGKPIDFWGMEVRFIGSHDECEQYVKGHNLEVMTQGD